MSDIVKLAKSFVISILSNGNSPTLEALSDIYWIRSGNKELLIEHIKAIRNIMNKALKELNNEEKNA